MSSEEAVKAAHNIESVRESGFPTPSDLRVVASLDCLMTSYRWVHGKTDYGSVTNEDFAELLASLETLHRLPLPRALQKRSSVWARILDESLVAMHSPIAEVRSAGRAVRQYSSDCINSLLDPRHHMSHGDAKIANAVRSGPGRIVLIDWDKCASVSPELDVAVAAFGIASCRLGGDDCLALARAQALQRADLDPSLLSLAFLIVGNMFLVHDWWVAQNTRSDRRFSYLAEWVLPSYLNWQASL